MQSLELLTSALCCEPGGTHKYDVYIHVSISIYISDGPREDVLVRLQCVRGMKDRRTCHVVHIATICTYTLWIYKHVHKYVFTYTHMYMYTYVCVLLLYNITHHELHP